MHGQAQHLAAHWSDGRFSGFRGIVCRGQSPKVQQKFFGAIHCGGVEITHGDLIIGDDDGVICVPLDEVNDDLLARCLARLAREAEERIE